MTDNLDADMDVLNDETPAETPEVKEPEGEAVEKTDEEIPAETTDEEEELDEDGKPKQKLAEEDETEEEKAIPQGRVSPKEVKAKFPEIFKEFPDLRRVIAHENEFAKIFGNVETARQAAQGLESFDILGKKIMDGDSGFLLNEVAKESPEAFEKFSSGFLNSVRDIHPPTFAKIITPYVKNLLRTAQQNPDKNISLAGKYLQRFLQLDSLEETKADPRIAAKEKELQAKEESLEQRQVRTFVTDTVNEGHDRLMMIIKRDLDPENVMTPKMRDAAAKEILEQANQISDRDERHSSNMRQLWRQAKTSGLNREARETILRAYLARVKPLLPGLRQKAREDYLGPRRKTKSDESVGGKTHIPSSGSAGGQKEKRLDLSKVDRSFYQKHSDMDILDQD